MAKAKTRRPNTSAASKGVKAYTKALGSGDITDSDAIEKYCAAVTSRKVQDPVTAYAKLVVAGEIVAGRHVRNTCQRHLDDLVKGPKRGLTWDPAAAMRAVLFFPEVLRLNGGQFEGIPFRLHISQAFRVGALFGWKRKNGTRRFRRFYDEEGKGNGKALALDTPIPTPGGWTTMGALRPGDTVFDEAGRPCLIIEAHAVRMNRDCFRVEFDDGEAIIADAEHLWRTEMRRSISPRGRSALAGVPKAQWGSWRVALRTTAQIADTVRYTNGKYASVNHSVALAGALELPEATLPVPPYTLGAWLGDGDTDSARITVAVRDWQIVECIAADGVPIVEQKRHAPHIARVSLSDGRKGPNPDAISVRLRALGVLGAKHIPQSYLRASIGQRLALLQGLMDTDGSVSHASCEFSVCDRRLAYGFLELAHSLGLKPCISESDATIKGRVVGRRWRINFWPSDGLRVFRLKRKDELQREWHVRRRLSADRRIVSCEPIGSVPVRCITVASASGMFLAGRSMVPTHNSPMLAGMGLYCMLADGEMRAEIYAAGSKKDQAMVLFRDAVAMVEQSPALATRIRKSGINPVWNLADFETSSFFKPISDDDGKSGPRPSCALCDEVHEHKSATTIEMLERGFKWRRQPLLAMATNSGSDRNSVCWREHQHAIRVAAGTMDVDDQATYVGEPIDDETLSYVCSLDPGDDPLVDPDCWIKANPLLGVTVQRDYLAAVVRQANAIPGKLNGIQRLHFCVWTDADQAWMSRASLEEVLADFDPLIHVGKSVKVGADLSGSQDLTALAFCVQTGTVEIRRDDAVVTLPTYDAWVEAWTPRDTLAERSLRDQAPYEVWVKGGWLTAVEGRNIRLDFVAARLAEANAQYQIDLLAYDRYSYRKLEEELDAQGLTLPQLEHPQGGTRRARPTPEQIEAAKRRGEEPPQGLWMPGSVVALETLILEKRIRLRRSPVLISAAMSAAMEHDPFDNRWFSKRRAVNRIDALVALAMAVGAAEAVPTAPRSIYETRGLLSI
jgi:phage terminase large subunit-like protein